MLSYVSTMWALALAGELQGIWFWSATYAAIVCGYSLVYQINIRSWPSTRGQLDEAIIAKFGHSLSGASDQEYRAEALYAYTVAKKTYKGHKVSPWIIVVSHNLRFFLKMQLSAVMPDANGRVDVFYKPNKPEKSYLIKPGKIGIGVTFTLGFSLAIAYFYRFHL